MGFYQKLLQRWHHWEQIAIEGEFGRESYQELHRSVLQICTFFQELNLQQGEVIALQLPKSPLLLHCILAGLAYGCPVLPLNHKYTKEEARFYLDDAQARLFICSTEYQQKISHGFCVTEKEVQHKIMKSPADFVLSNIDMDALAMLLYTSGTTGKPKGAMISHSNILATVRGLHDAWAFQSTDRLLHVLPLFHVHGLFVAQFVALYAQCESIWMMKFDASNCIQQLLSKEISVFMAVPTIYFRLLAQPGNYHFPALRLCTSGSAPLPISVHREFERRYKQRILERYGMTEVGIVLSNPYAQERRSGSVGFPVSGASLRIVHPERCEDVEVGEVGELWISGPSVISAYLRRPEQTAQTLIDSWLRSGDLASRDPDGYYRIAGRAKDLVISGGLNIYPLEIEAVFLELSQVSQAAGVGIPDQEWGERFVMLLILNAAIKKEELHRFARERLSTYKCPKEYLFVEEFPRNAMGKVQKAKIRKMLIENRL